MTSFINTSNAVNTPFVTLNNSPVTITPTSNVNNPKDSIWPAVQRPENLPVPPRMGVCQWLGLTMRKIWLSFVNILSWVFCRKQSMAWAKYLESRNSPTPSYDEGRVNPSITLDSSILDPGEEEQMEEIDLRTPADNQHFPSYSMVPVKEARFIIRGQPVGIVNGNTKISRRRGSVSYEFPNFESVIRHLSISDSYSPAEVFLHTIWLAITSQGREERGNVVLPLALRNSSSLLPSRRIYSNEQLEKYEQIRKKAKFSSILTSLGFMGSPRIILKSCELFKSSLMHEFIE